MNIFIFSILGTDVKGEHVEAIHYARTINVKRYTKSVIAVFYIDERENRQQYVLSKLDRIEIQEEEINE